MGNRVSQGYNPVPKSYLKDMRKITEENLKKIESDKKRRSSSMAKKQMRGSVTEINRESVNSYLINHPADLDDYIINNIDQEKLKAWVQESKGRSGDLESLDSSDDERDSDLESVPAEKTFRDRHIMLVTRSRLLYPARFNRDELNELIERPYSDEYEEEIESHLFPYTEVPPEDINKVFLLMVNNLLGKYSFPMPQLCYFLSCLKANYHNIEYHNYSHALSHAQSMYWIIRKNPGIFNELEMKCLMISSIAHDVAHPGVNDKFLKTTGSGLENLYMSPILENHHIQTCFLILQDMMCNVFCDLEGGDYKQVLDEIQHNILSTSVSRYNVQCESMRHWIATDFNLDNKRVRDAIKSVLMMTCDLCSTWKAWDQHKYTTWALYKEFFNQGDKEMEFDMHTDCCMTRMNSNSIPEYQVRFLQKIVLPVFQIATKVFPNISVILESTRENLDLWSTYLH